MESSTLFDDHNDLLLLFYKICSPLCLLVNGLAVYLIIFQSNGEMKTYRWYLLHYQIWASAIDIFLNFFYQPVFFFPLIAISGRGFFITHLGISNFICLCIYENLLCGLGASIVGLFLYRHQCIIEKKLTQRQFYFCILSLFLTIDVPINILRVFSYIKPIQWRDVLENSDPRAVEILKIPGIYYMPSSHSSWRSKAIRFISITFMGLAIIALLGHMSYVLWKQSKHLSIRTRKMQRRFFISLMWQVTVPLVFLVIPLTFIHIRMYDGHLGLQILNNINSMMISSYGIVATLCLMYFNEPYREFLIRRLKRRKTSSMTSFIQIGIGENL